MTHNDFVHILNSLNGLTPEQMQRLQRELASKIAAARPRPDADPLLGSMRDYADEMDQSAEDAMRQRGHRYQELKQEARPGVPEANSGLGSLGAMRDAADELDQIDEQAMKNRRERPMRLAPGE